MSEFDWWPTERLNVLVNALRGCDNKPPPVSDTDFWEKVVRDCNECDEASGESLDPEELAEDVHGEFESAQLVQSGTAGITIGDLSCAESRLVGLASGIHGVLYVASHPMEALWQSDGIEYHTVCVSIQEPSKTLASQLHDACRFLATHRPAVICSSSNILPAAVLAAFNYTQAKGAIPMADLVMTAEQELALGAGAVSSADLAELEEYANLYPPQATQTPKMKPKNMASPLNPIHVGGSSYDSTMTSFEAELSLTTPTKRGKTLQGVPSDGTSDVPTPRTCGIRTRTRNQKRGFAEVDGSADEMPPAMLVPPPPPVTPDSSGEMAVHAYIRSDCSRCSQTNVLGWRGMSWGGEMPAPFECCACHDAFDVSDDERDARLTAAELGTHIQPLV